MEIKKTVKVKFKKPTKLEFSVAEERTDEEIWSDKVLYWLGICKEVVYEVGSPYDFDNSEG